MTVNFIKNLSENNRVDKDISSVIDLEGQLRDDCDLINPVIRVSGNYNAQLSEINYAYIPEFKRYYFVTDVNIFRNGVYDFMLSVDVLMSFKDSILQQSAIIARQENEWNLNLNDDEFKIYQNPIIKTKLFPTGFTEEAYILAVAGAGDD